MPIVKIHKDEKCFEQHVEKNVNLVVQAGIKNFFDKAYRMHGSGVDGIGRSFWIAARINL